MLSLALTLALSPSTPEPINLFNGKDLTGWHADVPERDSKPDLPVPFIVRDKMLVSIGTPLGHLITDKSYENFKLLIEYRWPKGAGNSGIIVHVSKPRLLRDFLPQGIEAQLMSGRAGDFHLFGETLFSASDPTKKAGARFKTDAENVVGEWNSMEVGCVGDTITIKVNGHEVNKGKGSSVTKGQIAIQSEGTEIEFRKLELTKLANQD